ncbi:General transcription factor IIF subunit 2 [Dirofilaria immitis]|nr:General transcription factor IIF subunit 2 [Dirofilaria immitis]
MSSNGKRKFSDRVDSDCAKRGVWLVKVPRYLSEMWEKNVGHDVGRLVIKTANGKTDLIFKSNTNLLEMNSGHDKEASSSDSLLNPPSGNSPSVLRSNRIGPVKINKQVLRYQVNTVLKQIEKSSQPKRHVKQMEKAEVKFKPIAVHAEMFSADKDVVRQAVFHAFEKHQYYRLVDLQKLTSQPPGFVKEILTEIAVYNTMPPHKSMWELKPEYRSYHLLILLEQYSLKSFLRQLIFPTSSLRWAICARKYHRYALFH